MNNRETKKLETGRPVLRPFLKTDAYNMCNNWAKEEYVAMGSILVYHIQC